MPRLDHTPWQPGWLCPDIAPAIPSGAPQSLIMMLIERARSKGISPKAMEDIDVAVSITDDAIEHMIVMSRIQQ